MKPPKKSYQEWQMISQIEDIFIITVARLTQHIGNITHEEKKLGRRIFIINHIGSRNKCNMTDVVDSLQLPKSTATRQVDYLVKRNLVNRTIPSNNRRIVELTLTDEGKKIYQWFQEHLTNTMTAVLQEYSEKELNMMISVLPRVIAHSEVFLRKTGHWR